MSNFLVCLCLYLVSFASISAQTSTNWIIKFENSPSAHQINLLSKSIQSSTDLISERFNLWNLKSKHELTEDQVIKALGSKNIIHAYPNLPITQRDKIPNDESYSSQWNMGIINAPSVWEHTTGGRLPNGEEIVVAILDDGFDIDHTDIKDNIWVNNAEIPNDNIDNDNNGFKDDYLGLNVDTRLDNHAYLDHGTKVFGIIGAKGDNSEFISGVNWNVKVLLISGVTEIGEIMLGMDYLITQKERYIETNGKEGANVMVSNLSAGVDRAFPESSPDWCEFYETAGQLGILSVGAVPNANYNVDEEGDLPSLCQSEYFIAVTNTNRADTKVESSAYGPMNVDIGAPGENVLSLDVGNITSRFGGTSASAPHVAGAAALLFSSNCDRLQGLIKDDPAASVLLIKECLLEGSVILPSLSRTLSEGRLDLFNSLELLSEYCSGQQGGDLGINYINLENQRLTFSYNTKEYNSTHEVLIHDISGRLVRTFEIIPPLFEERIYSYQVEGLNLPTGLYSLSLISNTEKVSQLFFALKK